MSKIIEGLLVSSTDKKREANRRRDQFNRRSVGPETAKDLLQDGWERDRKLKTRVRLKIIKPFDERFENYIWDMFFRMGFDELNQGRNFTIHFKRPEGQTSKKQIDVFAKDDETIIVCECKSSEEWRRRSLQSSIEEFANLKGKIALTINNHYGSSKKFKFLWVLATQKIVISKADKERAAGENIKVIDDEQTRYLYELISHLGPAAKYQFLAEYFGSQSIPELKDHTVPAVRGTLGGKKFYCFVTNPETLLKIAFVNHRSLQDPEGMPTYQRLVKKGRIRAISKFIQQGGFFPTNILINFNKPARFDRSGKDENTEIQFGTLYLPDTYKSAWIIDGQHRIYGYSGTTQAKTENLIIIAFEGISKDEEARLFVNINHEQVKVPRNLLDDLKGDLEWGSSIPSKQIAAISSRLIRALNDTIGGPFHGRVTQAGLRASRRTSLTIPELMTGIRLSRLIGHAALGNKRYIPGPLSGSNDAETLARAKHIIQEYFARISDAAPGRWGEGRDGYLCTNPGIQGFLRLFAEIIRNIENSHGLDAFELKSGELMEYVEAYIQPIIKFLMNAPSGQIMQALDVKHGSGGSRDYFYILSEIVHREMPHFKADGVENWRKERSTDLTETADKQVKEIEIFIRLIMKSALVSIYGDDYWESGAIDRKINSSAYDKSLEYEKDDRVELINYLDLIEYKKIVEKKENWPTFKEFFDIPIEGQKGLAKNIKWFQRMNELRRVQAHPSVNRNYKSDDFDLIDMIHSELLERMRLSTLDFGEVLE